MENGTGREANEGTMVEQLEKDGREVSTEAGRAGSE